VGWCAKVLLDVGYDPPREIEADIMYLEVVGGIEKGKA